MIDQEIRTRYPTLNEKLQQEALRDETVVKALSRDPIASMPHALVARAHRKDQIVEQQAERLKELEARAEAEERGRVALVIITDRQGNAARGRSDRARRGGRAAGQRGHRSGCGRPELTVEGERALYDGLDDRAATLTSTGFVAANMGEALVGYLRGAKKGLAQAEKVTDPSERAFAVREAQRSLRGGRRRRRSGCRHGNARSTR